MNLRVFFVKGISKLTNQRFQIWFIKNKMMIAVGLILTTSIILSLCLITISVTAQKVIEREKLVTSIRIEKGDSLWSIASRYITEENKDINAYIEEIKCSNGLTSDTIHEGRYLIIPYYTEKY